MITKYINITTKNNFFLKKRQEQNKFWLLQTIEEQLKFDFYNNKTIKTELQKQLKLIEENKTTPFAAAEDLLKLI